MPGRIAALYRHPVKGFTPERLPAALLEAGAAFPCDRIYAVENGPSGFDPAAPQFVSKQKFTVLANNPALARARTRYDEASGLLSVSTGEGPGFCADLRDAEGRQGLADWLTGFLDPEDLNGPLRVLTTRGPHRFLDDEAGAVSLINLESVRDLSRRLGVAIDPLRFRANVYVEGWPAWTELGLAPGAEVKLGAVEARVVKPIVRCAATHVDPKAGVRDLNLVPALFAQYGHSFCGLYLQVAWGGQVSEGERAGALLPREFTPPQRQRRAPATIRVS